MVDYCNSVKNDFSKNISAYDIARKIYLTFPTYAFESNYDLQFDILNSISQFLSIPITSVHVAGSAKIGRSYHKNTEFSSDKSDLDVAIIDNAWFCKLMEICSKETKSFRDGRKLQSNRDPVNNLEFLKDYILKGIIFPENMPICGERERMLSFFNELSVKHTSSFKDINVAFYLSSYFFEKKQLTTIFNIKNYQSVAEE
ncbi:hypothetical protein AB6D37_15225 [Pectobacterium brasiliense]|uniref:hypothetical protein n=1 Tax=Pectobacterium brasiliense TaxID=180957 RepID=UPI0039883E61